MLPRRSVGRECSRRGRHFPSGGEDSRREETFPFGRRRVPFGRRHSLRDGKKSLDEKESSPPSEGKGAKRRRRRNFGRRSLLSVEGISLREEKIPFGRRYFLREGKKIR
jgi:hypothetical protein